MQCAYTPLLAHTHAVCVHTLRTCSTRRVHTLRAHTYRVHTLRAHTRSAHKHTEHTYTQCIHTYGVHTHSAHTFAERTHAQFAHAITCTLPSGARVCVCLGTRPPMAYCVHACTPPTRTGTHTQHAAHPTLHVRAHTHTHTHTLLHTPSPSLQAPGVHTGTPTRAVFCTHALTPSVRIPQFACTTQPCVPRVAGHCCHRSHVARPLVHCNLVLQLTTLPLPINSNG